MILAALSVGNRTARRATMRLVRRPLAGFLVRGLLAAIALTSLAAPAHADAGRLVLGYYVPYDVTSWSTLEAHVDQLDLIAAQWVTIDACGNLTSRDDQTLKQLARANGVNVVPSLLTLSGWLNHEVLADDGIAAHAVEQIVDYTLAEDYAGFDLDLEGVDPADRPFLTRFVTWLASALHDADRILTLAIPAKDRDVTVGWAGAYDYAALGAQADLVTVMAYEYRGPFSGPGSVAPYDWVERVAAFSTQQMPGKVLLGLAFYGYDWNTTSGGARSLGFHQAQAIADRFGVPLGFDQHQQSATFAYEDAGPALNSASAAGAPRGPVGHQVRVHAAPACDTQNPAPPPAAARPPVIQPGVPQAHEVWLEDSASAAARLGLAQRYAAAGVATWRLGLEDPRIWDVFTSWRLP